MLFNGRLKQLRERNGYSQIEISKLLNISNSLYSRYEKEIQIIPLKHLNTLSVFYNTSIDYIFNFNSKKNYLNNKIKIDKAEAGLILKNFRKEENLTQEKLANFLNTTHSVIADYERGRNLIATPFLYTICKKYNISADYLIGKTNSIKYLNNKEKINI